jgi:phthiodiolone/phenolphthiodiolone dimycocerosates ketoreductase
VVPVLFGLIGLAPSLQASLDLAVRAERDGFDSFFVGDHWMGLYPPAVADGGCGVETDRWYHPAVLSALVAQRTTTLTIGIGVTDLVRHHPVDLAHAWLTLAEAFPDRRFVVGLGLGEAENLTPYGLDHDLRVRRMAEGAEILRRLLAGCAEPVDGDYFRLVEPAMEPRRRAPGVEVWMAAHGPRTLAATARHADGWYPLLLRPESYCRTLGRIRDDAVEQGRDGTALRAGLAMNVIVVDSEIEAMEVCAHPLVRGFALWSSSGAFLRHGVPHPLGEGSDGFRDYIPVRLDAGDFERAVAGVPRSVVEGMAVVGTPDRIRSVIDTYEEAGAEHIVLWDLSRLTGRPGREAELIR